MSLKLRLASIWLPKSTLIHELERISKLTITALDSTLQAYGPEDLEIIRRNEKPMQGNLNEMRTFMCLAHNSRVAALVKALGKEKAIKVSRQIMFNVGRQLGQEVRTRLKVGSSVNDLLRAAKVLYKILGIRFEFNKKGDDKGVLCVDRCFLADHYSEDACLVLSAVDEGVVRGLNPQIRMEFKERLTTGRPACIAQLYFSFTGR